MLQDLLWEELTALDHMVLLARFKGVPAADIPAHVAKRLDAVGSTPRCPGASCTLKSEALDRL